LRNRQVRWWGLALGAVLIGLIAAALALRHFVSAAFGVAILVFAGWQWYAAEEGQQGEGAGDREARRRRQRMMVVAGVVVGLLVGFLWGASRD
jgi:threonine/homoserine/homoserine lactone efflux protein